MSDCLRCKNLAKDARVVETNDPPWVKVEMRYFCVAKCLPENKRRATLARAFMDIPEECSEFGS